MPCATCSPKGDVSVHRANQMYTVSARLNSTVGYGAIDTQSRGIPKKKNHYGLGKTECLRGKISS